MNMKYFKTILVNLIKRGVITGTQDDSQDYAINQVKYFNKTSNCEVISPYGLFSNPPLNSHTIVFNFNALEENKCSIAYLHEQRYRNLKAGEVKIGAPSFKNYIYFSSDGNIATYSPNNITYQSKNITYTISSSATYNADTIALNSTTQFILKCNTLDILKCNNLGETFLPSVVLTTTPSSPNLYMDGSGQLMVSVSSIKYKDKVESIDFCTDNVLKLIPKKFEMKDRPGKKEYGYIAEENYKVMKESVHFDKNGKIWGINDRVILLSTLEVVKKLNKKIIILENKLKEIENGKD